ncbi:hypothetical protein [Azonexus sp.]|uniref:hypothetical protein n=1 Tax=Azonexus sp. TaxID=1872668 RepID=UPI0027B9E570|nr:hypothetical protein [Azonexus sp.]
MNATIRVMPIVRNLAAIAAERALGSEWKEHPMFGIEVYGDAWAAKYQEQMTQLQTALAEFGKPHDPAIDQDEAISRAPATFEDAHRRLKGVVDWLIEQGFSALAYSVGGRGFPMVQIAYSESARRELRMVGAGSRTDASGKTFTRFTAQRNGVRIWWEREEGRWSYRKPV